MEGKPQDASLVPEQLNQIEHLIGLVGNGFYKHFQSVAA
jgi:hypothetical protein